MSRTGRSALFIAIPLGVTCLVGALSVGMSMIFFPPHFRGWGEVTADQMIAGWAVNKSAPFDRVEVQLYIDNIFIESRRATLSRPDVVMAGQARDEWCGYRFVIPAAARSVGLHEARVYAMHRVGIGSAYRTLQLMGKPLRFTVDRSGTVRPAD